MFYSFIKAIQIDFVIRHGFTEILQYSDQGQVLSVYKNRPEKCNMSMANITCNGFQTSDTSPEAEYCIFGPI